jgi:sugar phosphate isomerase/epimerase
MLTPLFGMNHSIGLKVLKHFDSEWSGILAVKSMLAKYDIKFIELDTIQSWLRVQHLVLQNAVQSLVACVQLVKWLNGKLATYLCSKISTWDLPER